MVLLLSKIFTFFFGKKASARPAHQPLLDFNIGLQMSFVGETAPRRLYHCRAEEGFNLVARVIDSERAVTLMKLSAVRLGDPVDLARFQGRIEALTDLSNYLRDSVDPQMHAERERMLRSREEKKSRVLNMRSAGTSAEAAM